MSNGSFNNLGKFGKTDYNFIQSNENMYDGTDWRQRAAGQPFFAQVQIFYPHRPFKRDPVHPVNADSVQLPPYYPDHPIARQDWALYLETVQHVDQEVGKVLQRLADDGLADSTIVFFFGDQGRPHVRAKQFLYDPGTHTPLIIRQPGSTAGQTDDQLISNIDLAPTAMQLAGIAVPDYVQGQSFLSPSVSPATTCSPCATAATARWTASGRCAPPDYKYIRNFYPERPLHPVQRLQKHSYPVLTLLQVMQKKGELTPAQARFMAATRPVEELYYLPNDPYEINNLADDAAFQSKRVELRQVLDTWLAEVDTATYPEDSAAVAYAQQDMQQNFRERMERDGLSPDISDEDFLKYWEGQLTPTQRGTK